MCLAFPRKRSPGASKDFLEKSDSLFNFFPIPRFNFCGPIFEPIFQSDFSTQIVFFFFFLTVEVHSKGAQNGSRMVSFSGPRNCSSKLFGNAVCAVQKTVPFEAKNESESE